MEKLIGREKELQDLEKCMQSPRSEFVIVYGRRRVGKTFLVRSFFKDDYAFHYVGAHKKTKKKQLENFGKVLQRYSGTKKRPAFSNWSDAFDALEMYLDSRTDLQKKVVFIDEMPWIDNKQSDFVDALEYFWNSWVTNRDDIVLVACGSATSWMMDKLVENRGGLRGRITHRIYLHPFSLYECKEYLNYHGFDWDEYQILQNYMVLGGVPYYLSLLNPKLSLPQNIDSLFFNRGGLLREEFDELYNALFTKAEKYIEVVELLSKHKEGLERKEIEAHTRISGGTLTKILKNLERCDFILGYNQLNNKRKGAIYRLVDLYTIFYYKFIAGNLSEDEDYWMHNFQTRAVEVWEGQTFELVCLLHLRQIKHALGISGTATETSAWRYRGTDGTKGAQVDLVIKRIDKITHLCEMKFSETPYQITKEYEQKLRERMRIFCEQTGISKGVVHTFVTPVGVKRGTHYGIVHNEVTAKDLFQP